MGLTLEPGASRRHYGGVTCVTRILAEAAGRSPMGYHQALDGPDGHWAKVQRDITVACARGHTAWAAARVERLSRLVRQAKVALTPELIGAAQRTDMEEDVYQARYQAEPTLERLEEWLRAKDRDVLQQLAERDAIAAEVERKRAGR